MKTVSRIFAAALALTIAALPVAEAGAQGQPPRHDIHRPNVPQQKPAPQKPAPQPHRYAPHAKPAPHVKPAPQKPHAQKPMPPMRKFSRGERFQAWKHYPEVRDHRRLGLKPPAPGQRWVKVDNNYLLITVASGVIAGIIAGR